jgi:hypothetical protein
MNWDEAIRIMQQQNSEMGERDMRQLWKCLMTTMGDNSWAMVDAIATSFGFCLGFAIALFFHSSLLI